jgi:AraC-like DNA-binding protein
LQQLPLHVVGDRFCRFARDDGGNRIGVLLTEITRCDQRSDGLEPRAVAQGIGELRHPRQLLIETDLTISQIADALGYRDVYFFSRQYKQVFGIPPTAVRASD